MKVLGVFRYYIAIISAALVVISVHGQMINTPCTASMISSFTPCINFITGSSSNGSSSPTTGCCDSLKSLMNGGRDCLCLLITANVPIQLPINRTLAISLPRACNMEGVPIQCQASGSPLPAPGPVLLGPSLPPSAASPDDESPLSPQASKVSATAPAPQSETSTQLTPPVSPPPTDDESETPTTRSSTTSATPGIRPVLTPTSSSASTTSSYISSISSLLQITSTIGFLVLIS